MRHGPALISILPPTLRITPHLLVLPSSYFQLTFAPFSMFQLKVENPSDVFVSGPAQIAVNRSHNIGCMHFITFFLGIYHIQLIRKAQLYQKSQNTLVCPCVRPSPVLWCKSMV